MYLLSYEEQIPSGWSKTLVTNYAIAIGSCMDDDCNGDWWLRSPIFSDGQTFNITNGVIDWYTVGDSEELSACPAINVNIDD